MTPSINETQKDSEGGTVQNVLLKINSNLRCHLTQSPFNFPFKNEKILNLKIDVAGCELARLVERFV